MQVDATPMPAERATATLPTLPRPKSRFGYSVNEVAEIFGKHPNTIYEWIKVGELTSRRRRRTHYIPASAIRALLDPEVVS